MQRPWLSPPLWRALSLLLVTVSLLLTGCEPTSAGLLSGKRATSSKDVERASRVTDGAAAANGDEWDSHLTALFKGPDAQVVYDLGAPTVVRSGWILADNDDTYEIALSDDGSVFESVWEAQGVRGNGLRARSGTFEGKGRYVRLRARGGDGNYSVSELQLYAEPSVQGPIGLKRAAGRGLDELARTSTLHVGLALLAVALFARKTKAFPTWSLALVALGYAFYSFGRIFPEAYPLDSRGVSLVRGVIASVTVFTLGWETFAPARFAPDRRATLAVLGACGVLGLLAFYNLGDPQFWDGKTQSKSYVHYLDLRQYHQTAKYFPEIGYRRLYDADVAAYLEDTGEQFEKVAKIEMRNLDTNLVEKIGGRRAVIEAMPKRFSPERWAAYKRDAKFFRETLGKEHWFDTMHDLGGNATPVWIANAYLLFNAFEASDKSFLQVASLDLLSIVLMFVCLGRTFGLRAAFVSMVLFGCNDFIMYGTNWGGAIFRHDWLVCLGFGICALATKRYWLAGAVLAAAAAFRAFPGLALIGVLFPPAWVVLENAIAKRARPTLEDLKQAAGPAIEVILGATITLVVLFAYSNLVLSPAAWKDWAFKIKILNADAHVNSVSLQALIAGETIRDPVLAARRPEIVVAMIAFVGAILALARKRPLHQGAVAGLLLLPIVMNPSNYYLHLVCFYPFVLTPRIRVAKDNRVDEKGNLAPASDDLFSPNTALAIMTLVAMCALHYFAVLVPDRGVHFYLLSVSIVLGLATMLFVVLRHEMGDLVALADAAWALREPSSLDAEATVSSNVEDDELARADDDGMASQDEGVDETAEARAPARRATEKPKRKKKKATQGIEKRKAEEANTEDEAAADE